MCARQASIQLSPQQKPNNGCIYRAIGFVWSRRDQQHSTTPSGAHTLTQEIELFFLFVRFVRWKITRNGIQIWGGFWLHVGNETYKNVFWTFVGSVVGRLMKGIYFTFFFLIFWLFYVHNLNEIKSQRKMHFCSGSTRFSFLSFSFFKFKISFFAVRKAVSFSKSRTKMYKNFCLQRNCVLLFVLVRNVIVSLCNWVLLALNCFSFLASEDFNF